MSHLKPGDAFYVTFVDDGNAVFTGIAAAGGSKKYKGCGLAVLGQSVAGPLTDSWPPASTTNLFAGVDFKTTKFGFGNYTARLNEPVAKHVADVVRSFAIRAFRRPVGDEELAEAPGHATKKTPLPKVWEAVEVVDVCVRNGRLRQRLPEWRSRPPFSCAAHCS